MSLRSTSGAPVAGKITGRYVPLTVLCCLTLSAGCGISRSAAEPRIEFVNVPLADDGGPEKLDVIQGRVVGAIGPGQRIVLFARSGAWYVQPYADQPFTEVQADSSWRSTTHLGTEYAALLVESGYKPPSVLDVLPGEGAGVISVAGVKGRLVVWLRWWFMLIYALAGMSALLFLYIYRLERNTRQLSLRFEERLAERAQVAQELHDTLLQGVISASMQLHVAVDQLPGELAVKPAMIRVLQVMGQVVEEGRAALKRLRSSDGNDSLDVEQAFSRIVRELAIEEEADFSIKFLGHPRPLHPIIADEVYRISREVMLDVSHYSSAKQIEVQVEYKSRHLRVIVRGSGCMADAQMLRSERESNRELPGIRERAERIGSRLRIRRNSTTGTQVELSIPSHLAFQSRPSSSLENLRRRLRLK